MSIRGWEGSNSPFQPLCLINTLPRGLKALKGLIFDNQEKRQYHNMNDKRHLKETVLSLYEKLYGNISLVCQNGGIDRKTFYRWKEEDPEFAESLKSLDPEEVKRDFIESKLMQLVREGDTAATIFACKTQLKHRGYVERTEVRIQTDEPIEVRLKIDEI